jgi:N-methylhydantoinase A
MEKTAAKDLRQESWRGRPRYQRSVDLRYRGQGYELKIPSTKNLLRDFEHEHRLRYGHIHPDREVELVTLRLRATIAATTIDLGAGARVRPGRAKLGRLSMLKAPVVFEGKKLETRIYCRDELQPGKKYSGPAVITEYSATTAIPPSRIFHLDRAANLVISAPSRPEPFSRARAGIWQALRSPS